MPNLTRSQTAKVAAAAMAEADRLELPASIAILDAGGHLLHYERTDGVALAAVEIAQAKAWTALAFNAPTSSLADWPDLVGALSRPIAQFGGGVPLVSSDQLIGSIGVGGADPVSDETIARSGAAVLDTMEQ